MYYLKKEFWIACSHRLHDPNLTDADNQQIFGKCNNAPSHGHNYKVILHLKSEELVNGMVLNFYDIKQVFNTVIDDVYDHQYLNDLPAFKNIVPSAENMCKVFYDALKQHMIQLYKIEIYETEGASASYTEE